MEPMEWTALAKCGASGAFAGLICDSILYPLDLCRARLNAPRPAGAAPLPARPFAALGQIFRELRPTPRAFYRGYSCVLVFAAPDYAIYFMSYEYWSARTRSELVGGFCAEATSNPVFVPYDVLKQRFMVGRVAARSSVFGAARGILRRDGPRGFYRGMLLAFATYGPFSAIYFEAYSFLAAAAARAYDGDAALACGAAAGAFAGAATQPIDWLKTRVQISSEVRVSVSTIIKDGIAQEGLGTVFRGTAARAFWLGTSCGITMQIYTAGKRAVGLTRGP